MNPRLFIASFILFCGFVTAKVDIDVGGEVIAGWKWDSREIYPNNEFYLRRIRAKLDADFISEDSFLISTRLSFDLNSSFAGLRDAYIEWKQSRAFSVGIGRRRKPFGIEELLGLNDSPSADWSEVHALLDDTGYLDRDIGAWIIGKFFQEPYQIEYDFGLFNGRDYDVRTSEKHFSGRLIYSPNKSIDIVGSFGTGIDSLGLEWRNAWEIGTIAQYLGGEFGGEFITGNSILSGEEFEGWQAWVKYSIGKFTPYVHYESISEESDSENRAHLGVAFDPTTKTRLCAQTSFIESDSPRSELKIQASARF
jgi:hypothetical protein